MRTPRSIPRLAMPLLRLRGTRLSLEPLEDRTLLSNNPLLEFASFRPPVMGPEPPPSGSGFGVGSGPATAFAGSGFTNLISITESEPLGATGGNDTPADADFIAGVGTGVGEDPAADITGALLNDQDVFRFSARAGDVISVGVSGNAGRLILRDANDVELIGSTQNISGFIYPAASPLVRAGNAVLAYVAPTTGSYTIEVSQGVGAYLAQLRLSRPGLEQQLVGSHQTIFLDFDGETINAQQIFNDPFANSNANLSPLSAFLPAWGLTAADENAVIDAIIADFERTFSTDIRANGNNGDFDATGIDGQFDVEILNSRDDPDPFGQPNGTNVSRVIIGGTQAEAGINTIGLAQSIDPGNYETEETAIVLLDILSGPSTDSFSLNSVTLGPTTTITDLIGTAVGSIASHEAGHYSGNFHTDGFDATPNIIDEGPGGLGNLIGIGPDAVFGSPDDIAVTFGVDTYSLFEGFTGNEDSRNTLAFGLSTGTVRLEPPNDDFADGIVIDPAVASAQGDNNDATAETGEPDHAELPAQHSVWWRWTAPVDGTALISTQGSDFDTRLAVYTGNSVDALTLVDENNDIDAGVDFTSEVRIPVTMGTVYHIAVDSVGGTGDITLTIDVSPTGLNLSQTALDESQPAGTSIGTFATVDFDTNDTFTYALVPGAGDDDNSSFVVTGTLLQTAFPLDFESDNSLNVRVRTTDQAGLSFEDTFVITVNDINEAPFNLALDSTSVNENQAAGALVGTFSASDPDNGDMLTFTRVAGPGSDDNGFFRIVGSRLETIAPFDFETRQTFNIRIQASDLAGLGTEEPFVISVGNVNEAPFGLVLSGSNVVENQPIGTLVGTFSASDPDAGDATNLTFSLIGGAGSNDNTVFRINGNRLETNRGIDFETQNSFNIRVRATDPGGQNTEATFTVTASGINEPPTNLTLSSSAVVENDPARTFVGRLSVFDQDANSSFSFALVGGPGSDNNNLFRINGDRLVTGTVLDFETNPFFQIRIQARDQAGLSTEESFIISNTDVNEPPTLPTLSNQSLAENLPGNTLVGILAASDPDSGSTINYSFTFGPGSDDNSFFRLQGNQLFTTQPFDFEAKSNFSIRVRASDEDGLFSEETFAINVIDVDDAPTTFTLSGLTVPDQSTVGTVVGNLSATGPLPGEVFSFSLVPGPGGADNPLFRINGEQLQTNTVINGGQQSTYFLRIRASGSGGFVDQTFTITVTPALPPEEPEGPTTGEGGRVTPYRPETIGAFDPATATWYLRSVNKPGFPDAGLFSFGGAGWTGVLGDWDGDLLDTVGVVDTTGTSDPFAAVWYLRNFNGPGEPNIGPFQFGVRQWIPVVGDWDGDGVDGIGMFDPATATWYLRNTPDAGLPDAGVFTYGVPGWTPVAGDWDGDGIDTIGVVDPQNNWYLRNTAGPGSPDAGAFSFGLPGWKPVVGDWDGNTVTNVAVVDPSGNWYISNNTPGELAEAPFPFGLGTWQPVAGTSLLRSLRASEEGTGTNLPELEPSALRSVVTASLPRLGALGVDAGTLSELEAAQVVVADLPGTLLGLAEVSNNRILLDVDAAGHGWFVDATPDEDAEFQASTPGETLEARAGTAAEGRLDLLTVVAHELAHLAGLEDVDAQLHPHDLLADNLPVGVRRTTRALDTLFEGGL
jgi:hypothetical protein